MKNYCLYNPIAGNENSKEKLKKLSEILTDGEIVFIDVTKTTYSEVMPRINHEDKIIICGGDGTLNKFVNAVDKLPENKIYLYATGTGNDFLTDIGGDKDQPVLINEYICDLPIVTVNGKDYKFINGIGYGIDGYCCEVGDAMKAQGKNDINYAGIAVKGLLFKFKPRNAVITADGIEKTFKKVWLAPTMNGRYYGGGMIPTPDQARLSDKGNVSVMVYYGSGKLKSLMVFPSIFKGEHVKHKEMVEVIEGDVITVKFDKPTALQIDGETVLGVTEYTVRSRNAIKQMQDKEISA